MKNFYSKYLKYYLCNAERPDLRRKYILGIILVAAMIVLMASNTPGLILSLVCGGVLSILLLTIAFYFGYLGLVASSIFCLFGIVLNWRLWLIKKEFLYLSILTFQFSIIIASFFISYLVEKERKKQKKLEWLSIVDGLTGVYNHRYFQQRLDEEIDRAEKNKGTLGLAMIDIDNFKKYNDTLGHKAGDIILKQTAEFLKSSIRECDLVFRYGGDEFVILMPEFSKEVDIEGFKGIIKSFRELRFEIIDSSALERLTLSMGLAVYPESAGSKEDLVYQADSALYLAKNAGRNRVQFYRDTLEEVCKDFSTDEHQIVSNLKILLATISVKDKYTLRHSERVSDYVYRISKALGLTDQEIKSNQLAALLHDIGKIEVPENVLNRKESLSEEEMQLVRNHPVNSAMILEPLSSLSAIIPNVRHHHERYDGSGYPDGLAAENIPLGARIISVVDAFDAMLSDRPYCKGMKMEEAMQQLVEYSGTQFDPGIVRVFLNEIKLSAIDFQLRD